jgi:putative transposase
MANTFTQLYVHIVFSVKYRSALLRDAWREELHRYITGIVRNKRQTLIAVNSVSDHIHILLGIKPDVMLSQIVREVKANSSRFMNERHLVPGRFEWQEGYGAFTCSHSQLGRVVEYIKQQPEHHRQTTFHEEYIQFLKKYNVPHDTRYVFDLSEEKNG